MLVLYIIIKLILKGFIIDTKDYKKIRKIQASNHIEWYLYQKIKSNEDIIIKSFKEINSENNEKLYNEYSLLKESIHSNIIKVYELVENNGKTHLVKEYFKAQTLDDYLKNKTLNLESFFKISTQICKAISFLHNKNIIHKNLSLSSILIDDEENIKISDLTYSYCSSFCNINNIKVAEPEEFLEFKAPEQLQNLQNQIDHRVDIYSLGVIFYYMLSGSLPYSFDDYSSFSNTLLTKKTPLIKDINKDIPIVLSKIIEKMMAKNIEERYYQVLSIHTDINKCTSFLNKNKIIEDFKIDDLQKILDLKYYDNLYGRKQEQEEIIDIINNINIDSNLLLCVSGISGIGKSTLIDYVLNDKKDMFSYIVKAKLDKYKQNNSYEILYLALRNLTKKVIIEDKKTLHIWKNKLNKLFDSQAQILIDVIPEIETIIGKQEKIEILSPTDTKARFDSLLIKYIQLFCEVDKPLCIFLDDVQWTDFVILKWLENAILNLKNIIFIVSYRDDEVKEEHIFSNFLNKMRSLDVNINELNLLPMSKNTIKKLIIDNMNLDEVDKITDIIYQKTRGNSFFVKQYLKQLQKDSIIYFDVDNLKWNCNLEQIYKLPISDNVFDILSKRVTLLPSKVQDLLNIASCIGSTFSQELLKKVYNDDELFDESINILLEEEWIISNLDKDIKESKKYSFSHDRMQQVVYSSLDKTQLKNIHLSIANNIYSSYEKLENKKLITCVNHFNISSSLINDNTQKEYLAKLNIKACKHTIKSGDFINALSFSKQVMLLYPSLSKSNEYISILVQRAQCEHLCHNYEEAIKYYNLAISLSFDILEKAAIYELIIKFYTDISDFKKAYEVGRVASALFNLKLPKTFNKLFFIKDFINVKIKLKSKKTSDLLNLPEANNENIIMLIRILSALLKVAYQIKPELCVSLSVKIINLCLKYGNTKESIIGYMVFGVIFQGAVLSNHNLGFEYSKLSILMLEKYNNTLQYPEV
ncbi:MAG: serine/threonine-protein kinase PknK, partial [Poseidonibacter sp.]|uniref:serine/threonine-protein kinase n=1 Tax=Poseidonibacter sp. TaxID=2321188 RepID=UPI00359EE8B3